MRQFKAGNKVLCVLPNIMPRDAMPSQLYANTVYHIERILVSGNLIIFGVHGAFSPNRFKRAYL